jgi:ribosomal protein S18 acetylase RimI-like enzyme
VPLFPILTLAKNIQRVMEILFQVFLLFATVFQLSNSFTSSNLITLKKSLYSSNLRNDVYSSKLSIIDIPRILDLAATQFLTENENKIEMFSKIVFLLVPKLFFPDYFGHKLVGVKIKASNLLVGFADLSLQQFCGSLNALKSNPMHVRKKIHGENLRPYLCNFLIASEFRRQGFGKFLLTQCVNEILSWGYSDIYLHVEVSTTPAISLYLSEKFEIVKKLKEYDVLFMHKTCNK